MESTESTTVQVYLEVYMPVMLYLLYRGHTTQDILVLTTIQASVKVIYRVYTSDIPVTALV